MVRVMHFSAAKQFVGVTLPLGLVYTLVITCSILSVVNLVLKRIDYPILMACGFKVYGLGMTLSILYSTHIQSLQGNNESTKVQNTRRNSYTPCVVSKTFHTRNIDRLCIYCACAYGCLAAPSPVSRLFHAGCTSS